MFRKKEINLKRKMTYFVLREVRKRNREFFFLIVGFTSFYFLKYCLTKMIRAYKLILRLNALLVPLFI